MEWLEEQRTSAALCDVNQHPTFRALVGRLANHPEFTKDIESLTSVVVKEVLEVIPMRWIGEFSIRVDAVVTAQRDGVTVAETDDINLYFTSLSDAAVFIKLPSNYILELIEIFAKPSDGPLLATLRSPAVRSKLASGVCML